jgi:hypothetical protein
VPAGPLALPLSGELLVAHALLNCCVMETK